MSHCSLCDSTDIVRGDTLPMDWKDYLNSERGFYIFSSVSVPICDSCIDRWVKYRDQYGYRTDAHEASDLLDDLILDNLIQLDDMGNEIEAESSDEVDR